MGGNKKNKTQNSNSETQQGSKKDSIIDFYLALLASKKGFPQKYNEPKSIFSKIGVPIFLGNDFVAPTLLDLVLWLQGEGMQITIRHALGQGYSYSVSNINEKVPRFECPNHFRDRSTATYEALERTLNSLPSEPLVVNKNDIENLVIVCREKELSTMADWYKLHINKDFGAITMPYIPNEEIYVSINGGFRCYTKKEFAVFRAESLNLIDFEIFYIFVKDRPFQIEPQPQTINPKEQTGRLMSINIFKMFADLMLTTTKKQPSEPEPPKDMNLHKLMMSTPGWDMYGKMPIDFNRMPLMVLNTGCRIPHPLDHMAAISMSIMRDGELRGVNLTFKHKPNKPKEEPIIGFDAASKELDKTAFELIFGNTKDKDPLKSEVGGEHYLNMGMQPIVFCGMLDLNGFQFSAVNYLSRRKGNELEELQKAKHMVQLAFKLDKSIPAKDYCLPSATLDIIYQYQKANNLSIRHYLAICRTVAKDYQTAEARIDDLINDLKNKATL